MSNIDIYFDTVQIQNLYSVIIAVNSWRYIEGDRCSKFCSNSSIPTQKSWKYLNIFAEITNCLATGRLSLTRPISKKKCDKNFLVELYAQRQKEARHGLKCTFQVY